MTTKIFQNKAQFEALKAESQKSGNPMSAVVGVTLIDGEQMLRTISIGGEPIAAFLSSPGDTAAVTQAIWAVLKSLEREGKLGAEGAVIQIQGFAFDALGTFNSNRVTAMAEDTEIRILPKDHAEALKIADDAIKEAERLLKEARENPTSKQAAANA